MRSDDYRVNGLEIHWSTHLTKQKLKIPKIFRKLHIVSVLCSIEGEITGIGEAYRGVTL